MSNFSVQQLINQEVRQREKRLPRHWSPSKLGSCLCGVYLERMGVEPDEEFDDRTLRVFSVGKLFEEWLVGVLKKTDAKFDTQVPCEMPEYDAFGYADLVVENGSKIVYEVKSKNSRAFWYMDKKKEGPNRQHAMQLWYYLESLKVDEGRILYLEKDTLTTLEYVIRRDDEDLRKEVIGELELLNRAWKEKVAPPYAEEGWQKDYCRWHKKCVSQTNYLT